MESTTLPTFHGKHMEMIRDNTIGWENCKNCTSSYSWARIRSRWMVLSVVMLMIVVVNDVTISYVCANFVISPFVSGCAIGYF